MAKKGRRATSEERLIAVRMYQNGYPQAEIARILNVGTRSIQEWVAKFRTGGLEALSTRLASGRPTSLSDEQMLRLYTMINGKDPRVHGFGLALWTRGLIRDLIKNSFNISVSLVTVGRILKKLGMSAQRPLYRAWKQDPERVEKWKSEEYPAIKARTEAEGASIWFADEASVRTDYHAGTTWAPVGQTPVVSGSSVRHAIKMVSAVSQRGGIKFMVHEGSMNGEKFVEFLNSLLHDIPGKIFLVVDGSSVHRAKVTKNFVASHARLELFFLPPYSPELNPDEWVNKNIKHDRVAQAVPLTREDLRSIVIKAFERLVGSQQIVRRFFGDPKLRYLW